MIDQKPTFEREAGSPAAGIRSDICLLRLAPPAPEHQATANETDGPLRHSKFSELVDGGQTLPLREADNPLAPHVKVRIGRDRA
jgi:hypothetical protein